MPAVTVSLDCGLGNQMFQYALGRALSIRLNIPLRLDLIGFEFDKQYKRSFGLDFLNIPQDIQIVRRPVMFSLGRFIRHLSKSSQIFSLFARPWVIAEHSGDFDATVTSFRPLRDIYVMGYWQDERYFLDVANTIKSDFSLSNGFSNANQVLASQIRMTENPVAVHVRRLHRVATATNAVPESDSEDKGLAVGIRYYIASLHEMEQRVTNPEFFVFSDYPQWARENLTFKGKVTYLENNRGPDCEDIALMSLCRHHIIANSSFSWWGAWLARSENKIVIAPRNVEYLPNIPEHWIRV